MAWKAWCLLTCVVSVSVHADDTERGKRFMITEKKMIKEKNNGLRVKLPIPNILEQYNDWDPANEYPFPITSTRKGYYSSRMQSSTVQSKKPKMTSSRPLTKKYTIARSDKLLLEGEAIAREHARLVHDINSLMEAYPGAWSRLMEQEAAAEPKDESIYMENFHPGVRLPIVKAVTRPPSVNLKIVPAVVAPVPAVKPISVPVIVVGGDANKQSWKALKNSMLRHPYAFVGSASTNRPTRLQPLIPLAYPMRTTSPTLWERFVSIFPRLVR